MTESSQQSDLVPDLNFVQEWHMLVSQYSKCKLTYPTDKLIAFAGVAQSMIGARKDHYVAGMWERNLVYDLAWWRSTQDRKVFPSSETRLRAPSWSWASVDGEIVFPSILGGVKSRFVEIIDCSDFVPSGSSSHTHGTIRAKGLCLPLTIEWVADMARFRVAELWFSEDDKLGSSVELECSNQEARELAQRGKLLLMPLFATPFHLHAIILVKTRGVGTHLRLGAVEIEILKTSSQPVRTLKTTLKETKSHHSPLDGFHRALEEQVELEDSWGENAVTLVNYILDNPQSYRNVYII